MIKTQIKMLLVLIITGYAFLARAQVAQEDAISIANRGVPYIAIYEQNIQLPPKYRPIGNGSCVAFVQAHGFAEYHGNAISWRSYINTDHPVEGGVVILNESIYGHLALITAVRQGEFDIVEQNYMGPYIVSTRTLTIDNPDILGFIR